MKYFVLSLMMTAILACTDKNNNGSPDYRDDDKSAKDNDKGQYFERDRPGSSAGTLTDANDANRTDESNHPVEGARLNENPPPATDTVQITPK